jgi:hypothetical protein
MEKFPSTECKLEDEYQPPFLTLSACLAFWNNHNPARQRFPNLLEPEGSPRPPTTDFAAYFGEGPPSPRYLHAAITYIVHRTLKNYQAHEVQGWTLRNVSPREFTHRIPAVVEIAKWQRISRSRVYKYLDRIDDELIRKLRHRKILSMQDF